MPPKEPKHSADTLEGLQERLALRKPLESYESYKKLKENGKHWLLCNSRLCFPDLLTPISVL